MITTTYKVFVKYSSSSVIPQGMYKTIQEAKAFISKCIPYYVESYIVTDKKDN